ncbi:trehalase family glycosidase [Herbiconiux sp. A18JL235]|uniref:Trehalase family glycosidase n=1 Tax=Herbiconiux sp. A18JL235 TaxID=3152363 RepID=A0AB39BHC1_9MICO
MNPDKDLIRSWRSLDETIRGWWDGDLSTATEADSDGTLLPLPHPYSSAGGSEAAFPEMYGWDTYFINRALLEHDRLDIVRGHVQNQLHMIETYGMVLNGNRTFYLTRSQPPLLAPIAAALLERQPDASLASRAITALEAEYNDYWGADHHVTSTGLTTNRDLGDPSLRPELASEAETGLDFTPLFEGDVRRFVPLITNSALVATARALAEMCERWAAPERAARWRAETSRRIRLINELCWDKRAGQYVEYNWVEKRPSKVTGLSSVWPLWAGVASPRQGARAIAKLMPYAQPGGWASTASEWPSPHPEWNWVQWQFPSGWPPEQIIVLDALRRYGRDDVAAPQAARFVQVQLERFALTGSLWERYNVAAPDIDLPVERFPAVPMHGWSSAAAVVLGRFLARDAR